jgi:hypothetical protein
VVLTAYGCPAVELALGEGLSCFGKALVRAFDHPLAGEPAVPGGAQCGVERAEQLGADVEIPRVGAVHHRRSGQLGEKVRLVVAGKNRARFCQ